jgi:hypothetical protein
MRIVHTTLRQPECNIRMMPTKWIFFAAVRLS